MSFVQRPKPRADQLLHPEYRTTNQHTTVGSKEDFYKFNPWRAPGIAPVYDPCGMAGGSTIARFNAGEYNTTKYAKQGDLGSKVLPPMPSGTVWRRGSLARARWQMSANHGGGYQFRLCPAADTLTEACFQRTPLEFGPAETHVIRFGDRSKDVTINATIVKKGGGIGWMKFPFPNYDNRQCDYVVQGGHHCDTGCPGCGAPHYAADKACPCDCSKQYPGLPEGNADKSDFPNQLPGHGNEDESKVRRFLQHRASCERVRRCVRVRVRVRAPAPNTPVHCPDPRIHRTLFCL